MICTVIEINGQIYLTNDEEIKIGDVCLVSRRNLHKRNEGRYVITKCNGFNKYRKDYVFQEIGFNTNLAWKIIASTQDLEGIFQIPKEFIQVCLDNDEVEIDFVLDIDTTTDETIQRMVITPVEKVQENTLSQYLIDDNTLVKVNGVEYNVNYLTFCNLRLAQKKGEITLEHYRNDLDKWYKVQFYARSPYKSYYKASETQEIHSLILDQMID
jgi:hypothetical protein